MRAARAKAEAARLAAEAAEAEAEAEAHAMSVEATARADVETAMEVERPKEAEVVAPPVGLIAEDDRSKEQGTAEAPSPAHGKSVMAFDPCALMKGLNGVEVSASLVPQVTLVDDRASQGIRRLSTSHLWRSQRGSRGGRKQTTRRSSKRFHRS